MSTALIAIFTVIGLALVVALVLAWAAHRYDPLDDEYALHLDAGGDETREPRP